MHEMLRECLEAALARLHSHAEPAKIDISEVDEFTFRFFVMAEIKRRDPIAKCHPEWKSIDLLVQTSTGRNIAIEFKFYVLRRAYPLDSASQAKPHWKGGAIAKNRGEFGKCIEKLRGLPYKEIHEKYLVLVYDRRKHGGKISFEESYSNLNENFGIDAIDIENCWCGDIACKLIQVS